MISFFRRFINSRFGVIITLGVLGIIAVAFALGDITNVSGSRNVTGGNVAEVGGTQIPEGELRNRAQQAFSAYRQQQPQLDMAGFVAQGGVAAVLARIVDGMALEKFANQVGMYVGKRAVDGEIASIPAFQGIDGKFSQTTYDQTLQQQRITDRQLRDDIARDTLSRHLLAPTIGASQVPDQVALPYASLLLERRRGTVAFIPSSAIPQAKAPTDAEVQQWYTRQRARYTIPERRTIRYAVVRAADVIATAKPTDADIAQAYKQQSARFAATEKRTLAQVILPDQASANALATKVKGGTAIGDAARASGLEPTTLTGVEKAAFAQAANAAAADAAFGAAQGAVVGPVRTPLGWAVIRVDTIEQVAGKTLDQARAELTEEVAKIKGAQALADLHDRLDTAAADNATFDEIVGDAKLTAQTSPAVTAAGVDPLAATPAAPDPLLAPLAQAAFMAEPGDSPQIIPVAPDGSFAVVAIGQVVPSAPRPLAEIRQRVVADLVADRGFQQARTYAQQVVAAADKGTALPQALQATKLMLPAPQPVNASRAELARAGQQLPAPIQMMFSMAAKRAKLLEAPNREGWFVVQLDNIQSGNAAGNQPLIVSTRRGLGGVSGRELAEQFTTAVRKHVGVERNEAAIAKVRTELSGGAAPAN